MPQFVWEGIFSILNVLVPTVMMALFAAHYQNRRKREIQIEGKLAIERIEGYEQILSCLYDGQNLHEVSLKEEADASTVLGYFDVETHHFQYPNAFKDEASFDSFYERLMQLQKDCQIYLDDKASRQLDRSIGVYTKLKTWMDAFCDTEHAVDLKVKESVARQHIDWMYKLMGMMMYSDCTRAFAEMDMVVCRQINRFYLTYRRHRIRKWLRGLSERIIILFEANSHKKGFIGFISRCVIHLYIGKEGREYKRIMNAAIQVMRYVHFSDRYAPREYFEGIRMPSEKEEALFGQVLMAMVHQS